MLSFHSMCFSEVSVPEQMEMLQGGRVVSLWRYSEPHSVTIDWWSRQHFAFVYDKHLLNRVVIPLTHLHSN